VVGSAVGTPADHPPGRMLLIYDAGRDLMFWVRESDWPPR
jgi:hypothetical protein